MDNFEVFYERRERNPLRKRELEPLGYNNKKAGEDALEEWEQDIPNNVQDTYQILKRRNPSQAEQFLQQKRKEIRDQFLKKKITPEYRLRGWTWMFLLPVMPIRLLI